jgi:hypothetical protein
MRRVRLPGADSMPQTLETARYMSLATFRKNGAEVATPVWFAPHAGALWVFSAGDAGKVKRLRNSPKARVAPCDMRGRVLGEWVEASASIVDDPRQVQAAHAALVARYGWQMRLLDCFSKLGGRYDTRAFIRVELVGSKKRR